MSKVRSGNDVIGFLEEVEIFNVIVVAFLVVVFIAESEGEG